MDADGDSPSTLHSFTGPPVPQGEGTSVARAFLDGNHTLISVMARINPSPDWFVGLDSFQLCVEGNWVDTVTVEVITPVERGGEWSLISISEILKSHHHHPRRIASTISISWPPTLEIRPSHIREIRSNRSEGRVNFPFVSRKRAYGACIANKRLYRKRKPFFFFFFFAIWIHEAVLAILGARWSEVWSGKRVWREEKNCVEREKCMYVYI